MCKRMLVVHHCTSMFRALKQNLCCMFRISRLAVCESTRKLCSAFQITGHREFSMSPAPTHATLVIDAATWQADLSTKITPLESCMRKAWRGNTMHKHVKVHRNDGHAWINGKGLESDKTWVLFVSRMPWCGGPCADRVLSAGGFSGWDPLVQTESVCHESSSGIAM